MTTTTNNRLEDDHGHYGILKSIVDTPRPDDKGWIKARQIEISIAPTPSILVTKTETRS